MFLLGKSFESLDESENPEEHGSYYEGDILFPKEYEKNGMKRESLRWKNGVIPFQIRGSYSEW